jgi:large subunit ribosomal protein L24
MRKIRKNDEVIVLAGKDKGKKSTVNKVIDGKRVLLDGINIVKKHTKPNPNAGVTGGIIDKEMPLAISNIALLNPATKKADKVGIRVNDKGLKERFFRSNGDAIDI